jgi:acyl-CoA dehydrogenase
VADKVMLLARTTPVEACKRPQDGLSLFYTNLDRRRAEVRLIHKMGRHAVDSNQVFFDGMEVPEEDRIGEEGRGFAYLLDSLNPERQNQAIQHPLALNWIELENAFYACLRAAWLYDNGLPCGPQANAAKYCGADAGYRACLQSVLTHGGMGYAQEYHVERLLRESVIAKIAPVTEQLILSNIAERVLKLPKSY